MILQLYTTLVLIQHFCIRERESFLQKRICYGAGRIRASEKGIARNKEGRILIMINCVKSALLMYSLARLRNGILVNYLKQNTGKRRR